MIDKLTPAQLERFVHLQAIVDRQQAQAAKVRAFRNYYVGDHPILLSTRQQEYLGDLLGDNEFPFVHNVAKSIVDTLRERLSVTGFTVNGQAATVADDAGPSPDTRQAGLLWDWWTDNRMDGQQIRLYRRAIRDGRSYVMVDYDSVTERPRLTLHKLDDGTSGVLLHRDPGMPDKVLYATRYWYTFDPLEPGATGKLRKTVYLPDQIRKYVQGPRDGSWESIQDDGDPGWPIPWVDGQGEPMGVAVIEFENPGGSEIEQILGLQNGLNKSWVDLMAAADAHGFPILAAEYPEALGVLAEQEDDADLEDADEFRVGPGRVLELFGGQMKRIEAGDLGQLIETIWTLTAAISGVSRTPQYYLRPVGGSDVPSGEALKQLESGLIQRAKERQILFGQAWSDVMVLALRVAATFGPLASFREPPVVAPVWADPNVRNEALAAQTAEAHDRLGVPRPAVWQLLGYTPEEVAEFREQARTDRTADVAALASRLNLQERRNQPQRPAPADLGRTP